MPKSNDWTTEYPNVSLMWSKENSVQPYSIRKTDSETKYKWVCEKQHEWFSTVANQINIGECSYCAGNASYVETDNLFIKFPKVAEMFNEERNSKPVTAVLPHSKRLYHWKCSMGHEWLKEPYREIRSEGVCLICTNRIVVPGVNDLSILRPDLKKFWSVNNTIKMNTLSLKSGERVKWVCEHNHEYERLVFHQTEKETVRCPVCPKPPLPHKSLPKIFKNVEKLWGENNVYTPDFYSAGSHKKVEWKCDNGESHEYLKEIRLVVRNRGVCVICNKANQQEKVLSKILEEDFGIEGIENNVRCLEVANGSRLELDIVMKNLGKSIEFNGERWHRDDKFTALGYDSAKDYHAKKREAATEQGLELAFVWSHDWSIHRKNVLKALRKWLLENDDLSNHSVLNRLESSHDVELQCC